MPLAPAPQSATTFGNCLYPLPSAPQPTAPGHWPDLAARPAEIVPARALAFPGRNKFGQASGGRQQDAAPTG